MSRFNTTRYSYLVIIVSFLLTTQGRADLGTVNVVIKDFKYGGKITKPHYKQFIAFLNKQLTDSGDINTISGPELDLILMKNNIQQDGCESIDCLSEIGRASKAPIIISGSLLGRRNKFFLDIFIIDATNYKVLTTEHLEGVYSKFIKEGSQSIGKMIQSIIDKKYPRADLEIISQPKQADVIIGGQIVGKTPVKLEIRRNIVYSIRLEKQDYESYTRSTGFQKRRNNVSVTLQQVKGILQISGFPYGSKVFIEGRLVGRLPQLSYKNNPGNYNLQAKKQGYKKYSRSVVIKPGITEDIQIRLRRKPKLPSMIASAVFPGSGQMIRGKPIKGLIFAATAVGIGYLSYLEHLSFERQHKTYQDNLKIYNTRLDLNEIDNDINRVWKSFDKMNNIEKQRNQMLYSLGAVWTINIFEILFD